MVAREKLSQRALSPYFSEESIGKRGRLSQNDSRTGRDSARFLNGARANGRMERRRAESRDAALNDVSEIDEGDGGKARSRCHEVTSQIFDPRAVLGRSAGERPEQPETLMPALHYRAVPRGWIHGPLANCVRLQPLVV